jgi:ADP-ribose pyrophosphatase YjhB (NUDIX family)
VWRDGRVLLHRPVRDNFWSMPGGRVEWLESAADALRREMREELGLHASVERLLWVVENFFVDRALSYHELALYFLVSFPPDAPIYHGDGPFYGLEETLPLVFQWFPTGGLEAVPLYPAFLRTALRVLPVGIEHIVHHDKEG